MKISKQLSKILISVSFFLFVQFAQAQEIKEIWSEIEKKEVTNTKSTNNVIISSDPNQLEGVKVKLSDENIVVDQNLDNSNILLAGLFDPDENDLKLDMWSKTDGTKIKKLLEKIQSKNLSSFSERLMDVALLTNSYIPNQNFSLDEFENFTLDHLIKKKDFDLVEEFIQKNSSIKDKEKLIKHVADYYLSLNKIENSCSAIDSLSLITDEYLTYFKIYCLITQNRKDEAQLLFDLNSELDSLNDFFVKKFEVLMGYEDNNFILSDENILYFHLSHKTDNKFLYYPSVESEEFIWKYLSNSNLLKNLNDFNLSDIDQVKFLEKATSESIFDERDLLNLYKKFQFEIDDLINYEEALKNLPDYEGRALMYQRFLLTDNLENKLSLLSRLNNSLENSNFKKSFDDELSQLLKKMDKNEIPSKFLSFYQTNLVTEENKKNKIKFNNEVFHQSKVLNYILDKQSLPKTQKLTDNLLSKMKKNKNYSFNFKDVVLLESLRSDGIQIDQIDELSKYKSELNPEFDEMIDNKESGMILLKLVEIIGENELDELNSNSLFFIIEIMNRTKLISLRNELLLEILPLKV
ncbi:hypothetical protein IDG52_00115 [Pelagibacterales bacterium SAG-MED23]|nr:hypothetical protein [Pelagibacterales bacterium SAG-MED23]